MEAQTNIIFRIISGEEKSCTPASWEEAMESIKKNKEKNMKKEEKNIKVIETHCAGRE